MLLKELAQQIDRRDFERLYYDPTIHSGEIAARFGVAQSRLSELAHLLKIKTRREAGVCYTPTLRRAKDAKLGPCGPLCREWRRCTRERLWVDGPLPCESTLDFEVGYEYESDSQPTLWTIPLTAVRLRVEVE